MNHFQVFRLCGIDRLGILFDCCLFLDIISVQFRISLDYLSFYHYFQGKSGKKKKIDKELCKPIITSVYSYEGIGHT